MNKATFFKLIGILFLSSFFWSCNTQNQAAQIIQRSLEAHGGIKKWQNANQLSYQKKTILYDSLGAIEKEIIQWHINRFTPDFSAKMIWQENTVTKKVVFSKGKISVLYNDTIINDKMLEKQYYKTITAANYVVWQPYKLLEKDVVLSYEGEEHIDGKQARVVKASYYDADGSAANIWWYYFDAKTYKLLGNMVHHGVTYSFIKNIAYENQTGLFLNAKRKSYMIDSLRNIKFLRADYFYNDFIIS